ncbi:MAG: hypothetical protein WB005_12045 [Pseudolabrys sp.]
MTSTKTNEFSSAPNAPIPKQQSWNPLAEPPPARPTGQEAQLKAVLSLSAVSLPPTMIHHPASHAEDAGPIYFSNRLRIADVCPSIHFIADDFLRFALKPACALLPLPARVFGVQQYERNRSLRTGKSLRVLRF